MDDDPDALVRYGLSDAEIRWIDTWNDLITRLPGGRLPGFPLWADDFRETPVVDPATPAWKAALLTKNSTFYLAHRDVIDAWKNRHDGLAGLIPSRRKLEWQAGDAQLDPWQCGLQFRPSGIRAKRPTYMPALVAVAQTSIHGPSRRRLTPREAARLQGFPDTFDFGDQSDAATYKQLGNAVHPGVVRHIVIEHAKRDLAELRPLLPGLVRSCGL